jgi:hypothetical protein
MSTAVFYELAALSSFLFNMSLCDGQVPSSGVSITSTGEFNFNKYLIYKCIDGGSGIFSFLRQRSDLSPKLVDVGAPYTFYTFITTAAMAMLPNRRRLYYFNNTRVTDFQVSCLLLVRTIVLSAGFVKHL